MRIFRRKQEKSKRERALSPPQREVDESTVQQLQGLQERVKRLQKRFDDKDNISTVAQIGCVPDVDYDTLSVGSTRNHLEEMSSKMEEISRKIDEQNSSKRLEERIEQLLVEVEKIANADKDGNEEEPIIPPGPIASEEYTFKEVKWNMSAYQSYEPHADVNYFPGLRWQAKGIALKQVISAIIPCFNEGGNELRRTIQGLHSQYMHRGWRMEGVIVMDGVDNMDESMATYLEQMFGVAINSKDPERDPFMKFPSAETIIIHAADEDSCNNREPVSYGSIGGYSLILKRVNRRKANSQMWWLGAHARSVKCLYALATDCGTVFDKTTTIRLVQRLNDEGDLHAVTGFQRTMSSRMQGDSNWEACLHPFDFMLRMLQRFEFEVDHVGFKSVDDSIGAMHVIPGPCGLYRYKSMGSLKSGLMHHYFQIFRRRSSGLIIGNVELVEDRIPGALLSFPLKPYKDDTEKPSTGWSRTGFCHEALFYLEAEKPLSQLVKQRRRWLNGTYATYIWLLAEGIITNSNQAEATKYLSWILVALHIIQGAVVRFCGPALLIVWMWRFGLFLPDILEEPANIFDPSIVIPDLEESSFRLMCSFITGGGYALLYIWFVLAHTPRAVPVVTDSAIVRYTEATTFKSDKASAFRPFVMYLSVVVNMFVVFLFIANAVGIVCSLGWDETPIVVKVLISMCFVPAAMGLLDGIIRCDFRCFFQLIFSSIPALPLLVWFTVWLPAYATTRASDLTWGNRGGSDSLDKSDTALERARRGQKLALSLIFSNLGLSALVIWRMQTHGQAFPMFVLSYTLILSLSFALSFLEMICRFFSGLAGGFLSSDPRIDDHESAQCTDFVCGDVSDFTMLGDDDDGDEGIFPSQATVNSADGGSQKSIFSQAGQQQGSVQGETTASTPLTGVLATTATKRSNISGSKISSSNKSSNSNGNASNSSDYRPPGVADVTKTEFC